MRPRWNTYVAALTAALALFASGCTLLPWLDAWLAQHSAPSTPAALPKLASIDFDFPHRAGPFRIGLARDHGAPGRGFTLSYRPADVRVRATLNVFPRRPQTRAAPAAAYRVERERIRTEVAERGAERGLVLREAAAEALGPRDSSAPSATRVLMVLASEREHIWIESVLLWRGTLGYEARIRHAPGRKPPDPALLHTFLDEVFEQVRAREHTASD